MKKTNHHFTLNCFVSFLIFTLSSSFVDGQDTTKSQKPLETGFYMNNGCTKVDSITCYGYEGLCFIHDITNVMLAYDKLHMYLE